MIARKQSAPYVISKFFHRNKTAAALVAFLLVVPLVAIGWALGEAQRARQEGAAQVTAVERRLADLYQTLGDWQSRTATPDLPAALRSQQEALRIRTALAEAAPGDKQLRKDLAASLNTVADLLQKAGDAGQAESLRAKARSLQTSE